MDKVIKRWFPEGENSQVRWYYLTSILLDVWFVEAVWYFYWGKFGNYQTIGAIFALLTIIWVVLEIPTGWFADKVGRKKSTVLGTGIMVVGAVIVAGGHNLAWLIVGGLLENVGRAFVSGALEALIYEEIKRNNKDNGDEVYGKVAAARIRWQIAVYGLSVIIGGWLFSIYFRLAHIIQAIILAGAFWASTKLKEARSEIREKETIDYWVGFRQLMSKKMGVYIWPLLIGGAGIYLYDWGLAKPNIALKFGYGYQAQGIIFGIMGVINTILLGRFSKWRKKIGDFGSVHLINLIIGGCFVIAGLVNSYVGLVIILLMEMATAWGATVAAAVTNKYVESKYRATTLSTVQFITKIPFVLTMTMMGRLVDKGEVDGFYRITGGLGLAIGIWSFFFFRKSDDGVK